MTRRLYWQDPYCREFEAHVAERLTLHGKPALVLDATCFYPTSGGQPYDTGTLNEVPVLEVQELEGRVVHLLAQPVEADTVHGRIDWERRWNHMQQHTGQHILSQAFERLLDAETVSFHLGEESCTIDLGIAELRPEAAVEVESLANHIVLQNRAVTTCEYAPDEVALLELRRAPQVEGSLRIVRIAEFDTCACSGTHVRATGEVGTIHIRRWSRQRGNTRVEFLCGWRALRDYQAKDRICQALANALSAGVEELPEALARVMEAEHAARRQCEALRERLLALELPRLAAEAELFGEWQVLCRHLEGYDAGNMRYMAQQLTQEPGRIVLLSVREPSPQVCFARSQDIALDMAHLLREVLSRYGGKGGGRPHVAQGGGMRAEDLATLLADALAQVQGNSRGA